MMWQVSCGGGRGGGGGDGGSGGGSGGGGGSGSGGIGSRALEALLAEKQGLERSLQELQVSCQSRLAEAEAARESLRAERARRAEADEELKTARPAALPPTIFIAIYSSLLSRH